MLYPERIRRILQGADPKNPSPVRWRSDGLAWARPKEIPFFFSSIRRHTRSYGDWSSDVCSSDLDATTNAAQVLFQTLQYRSFAGPAALRGIRSSKITPTLTYNTVDNPVNPTHGKSLFYSVGIEGLGGNARSITQVFDAKYFRPVNHKRNVLGFHLLTAFTTGYGGVEPSPYQRFFTGGDDSVRGFDIRTISPITFVPVA